MNFVMTKVNFVIIYVLRNIFLIVVNTSKNMESVAMNIVYILSEIYLYVIFVAMDEHIDKECLSVNTS